MNGNVANNKNKKVSMKEQRLHISHGSVTVEAAFAFPIFFFAVMLFLYFFQFLLVRTEVQKALFQTASFCSQYAYFTAEFRNNTDTRNVKKESIAYQGDFSEFSEGLLDMALVKLKFQSCLEKKILKNSCLDNVGGISLLQSELMVNERDIDIIAVYRVRFPLPFFQKFSFRVTQQAKTKAFLGKSMHGEEDKNSGEEDNEEIVYITETGKVYHCSMECAYLNPSVREVSMEELENIRNQNGSIYAFCDSCCEKKKQYALVYITTWGLSYHSRLSCPGLKRTIREEKITEARKQGYHACSKCGREG